MGLKDVLRPLSQQCFSCLLESTILGQVNSGDKCWYQGYGGYADTYDWHKVFMGSGNCSGQTGYVASSLVYWGT